MFRRIACATLLFLTSAWADPLPLANVKNLDFSLRLGMPYATAENPLKKVIYPEAKCLLRRDVAEALIRAHTELKLQGFGVKLLDCYRPLSWETEIAKASGDKTPAAGVAATRGAAVELVLLDSHAEEVPMPTVYPERPPAGRARCEARGKKMRRKLAQKNCEVLETALKKHGFLPSPTLWWHYEFPGWEKEPARDVPFSAVP